MTVENCQAECLSLGYAFAGVEYGSECWCDSALQNDAGPAPDGEAKCTMPCNGDAQQMCGGPDRLNIYQNTAISTPTSSPSASSTVTGLPTGTSTPNTQVPRSTTSSASADALPTGWKYAGCYVDNINGRIMEGQQPDNDKLTIESCVSTCVKLGYTVAGAQYSKQCFCDNYVRKEAPLADDKECSMSCSGDSSEKCGAPDRMSVYSEGDLVVLPNPAPQTGGLPGSWEYQGCLE